MYRGQLFAGKHTAKADCQLQASYAADFLGVQTICTNQPSCIVCSYLTNDHQMHVDGWVVRGDLRTCSLEVDS